MNIGNAFPSKYLKASDLQGGEFTLTIANVVMTDVSPGGQGAEERPVIHFEETEKALVLNKTNALEIASEYTDETDDWTGKRLVLYCARVQFQGRVVDGLRVRIPGSPDVDKVLADAGPDSDPLNRPGASGGNLPF
jgi:hypothetical protein